MSGVYRLVFKAIRGRDGFTRDFGCGRYENLSGAISWLTFFAGGAADVRRRRIWFLLSQSPQFVRYTGFQCVFEVIICVHGRGFAAGADAAFRKRG